MVEKALLRPPDLSGARETKPSYLEDVERIEIDTRIKIGHSLG